MIDDSSEIFENDVMRLEWKEGILHGWYKKGNVTLDIAKRIVSDRRKFTKNQPVKMIVKQSGLRGIERDARQYLSSPQGIEGVLAGAIIVNSAFETHLANFFLNITVIRPKIPTKLFRTEQEALKWLNNLEV